MLFPPSQDKFQKPFGFSFFSCPRSSPSENFSFPVKSISLICAFGPSVTMNETCCPAPPIVFASCFTVANG